MLHGCRRSSTQYIKAVMFIQTEQERRAALRPFCEVYGCGYCLIWLFLEPADGLIEINFKQNFALTVFSTSTSSSQSTDGTSVERVALIGVGQSAGC
jgi:hypothetical protein